ncbi:uncharacterized protein [Rutidosis leptorrhynchoides]|uniref:uncharacterized protein n=1 Tax=Rutidosis leptorrhynchoides TaxID=125765 RepID=UPI003A998A6F
MTSDKPKDWVKWFSLAEYWYNTNYHTSICTTPYEIVYEQPPPMPITYTPGESKVEAVDRSLVAREEAVSILKFHLKRAQDRMKHFADRHRTDREFNISDWVYVKLQPHRQVTLRGGRQHKLSPKYYGPFVYEAKVGKVAYKLQLPTT